MAESFPLQTVMELMHSRTETAARELGKLVATEQDANAKLQLLENYRTEYIQRFQDAAKNGISPQQWANYQDFTYKLDDAVAQQTKIVAAAHERTLDGQRRWLEQRNKAKAFDTLAQKHEIQQRYQEGKQEQKFSDELTSRKHRLKHQGDE